MTPWSRGSCARAKPCESHGGNALFLKESSTISVQFLTMMGYGGFTKFLNFITPRIEDVVLGRGYIGKL